MPRKKKPETLEELYAEGENVGRSCEMCVEILDTEREERGLLTE